MMFAFHAAVFLGFIAFVSGAAIYIWAVRNRGAGANLAKYSGIVVMILTLLSVICTVYSGIRHMRAGYFECPMHRMMQMGKGMRPGIMECPCMKKMEQMKEQKE